MRLVKLCTIDSTNDYLKALAKTESLEEDTVVWALEQTKGRGQMGTSWTTEAGKNLTFSIFRKVKRVTIDQQFYVTMAASLAVKDVLQKLLIKNITVKWPNDIMSDKQKICGILIESVIKKGKLHALILGVGLNVNQTDFGDTPRATSIKDQTGIHFDLKELLNMLLKQFHHYVALLLKEDLDVIKTAYEADLFRKNKASTFIKNGQQFTGIIQGVTPQGKLMILEEDEVLNEYDLKELQLLF
ncbi:MAG: BirA family biotin operon repressor/biotin-[acetyl-CoA-carboxylase] ligase [Flavobacteriales bacterium]|jgi:BirA family biotin operon repressor/biotin-[acetyl-CoA-carboxylase] ligase